MFALFVDTTDYGKSEKFLGVFTTKERAKKAKDAAVQVLVDEYPTLAEDPDWAKEEEEKFWIEKIDADALYIGGDFKDIVEVRN